jgi:hypothetical protein
MRRRPRKVQPSMHRGHTEYPLDLQHTPLMLDSFHLEASFLDAGSAFPRPGPGGPGNRPIASVPFLARDFPRAPTRACPLNSDIFGTRHFHELN